MGIVSYAQNFEDVILWRALEDVTPGFYIDVGAQHPVVDSVSKAFYEQGWRGIHVEPTLEHASLLRADRPDETVVQAIVAERAGAVRFYEIPGTGLSTARQDIAEEHHSQRGFPVQSQVVTAVTLDDLLGLAPSDAIHWLKIDVEGFEREVLTGWRESARRPWVVVIEATYPNSTRDTFEDWESLMLSKGYSLVYRDGLNRYYLHESQSARAARFVFPPNVFDGFQLSGTATSMTAWLLNRHRETEEGLKTECDAAMHEYSARLQALQEKCRAAEAEQLARQSDVLEQALNHARLQHQSEVSRLEGQLQDLRDALGKAREDAQFQREALQKLAGQALEARHATALEQLKQRAELERHYVEKIDSLREEWRKADAQRVLHADQALKNALDAEREHSQKLETVHVAWRAAEVELTARHAQELTVLRESLHRASLERAEHEEVLKRDVIEPARQLATEWQSRAQTMSMHIDILQQELSRIQSGWVWRFVRFFYQDGGIKSANIIVKDLGINKNQIVANGQNESVHSASSDERINDAPLYKFPPPADEFYLNATPMNIHHVNDLLLLGGEALVEAAYQALLGRKSDPDGRFYYINRLRSGVGKTALIAQIALSKEAQANDLSLPGLEQLIKVYRQERHWLWGWWYRQLALERTVYRLEDKLDHLHAHLQLRLGGSSLVNPQPCADAISSLPTASSFGGGQEMPTHYEPLAQRSEIDLPVQVRRLLRRMNTN